MPTIRDPAKLPPRGPRAGVWSGGRGWGGEGRVKLSLCPTAAGWSQGVRFRGVLPWMAAGCVSPELLGPSSASASRAKPHGHQSNDSPSCPSLGRRLGQDGAQSSSPPQPAPVRHQGRPLPFPRPSLEARLALSPWLWPCQHVPTWEPAAVPLASCARPFGPRQPNTHPGPSLPASGPWTSSS